MGISYRYSKFLSRILITLALLIFLHLDFPAPAWAGISTVDAFCEQNPVGCSNFAKDLGINNAARGAITAPTSSSRVVVDVLDDVGNVVTKTTATVERVNGTNPFVVLGRLSDASNIVRTALDFAGLSPNDVTKAQELGKTRYFPTNPNDPDRPTIYRVRTRNPNVNCDSSYTFDAPYGYSIQPNRVPEYRNLKGCGFTGLTEIAATQLNNAIRYYDGGFGDPIAITPVNGKPWQEMSEDKRRTIIDGLTASDYARILNQVPSSTNLAIPDNASSVRISPIDGDDLVIMSPDGTTRKISVPTTIPLKNPEPTPEPTPTPTPTPTPEPTKSPAVEPTPTPTPDPSPSPSPSPSGDPSPSPSPSPSPTPQPDPNESPQVDFSTAENFLVHAKRVFSDKFPFDILGDFEAKGNSNECPKYTFFSHEFELCPIRDFLSMLKIPVIISFLIWAFMSI